MPQKKRQRLLSPKTASVIRQRRNRSQEHEQRERRLSANREFIAQARQNESVAQRQSRLSTAATRTRTLRSAETPELRVARQTSNAATTATARQAELPEQRLQRLQSKCQRRAKACGSSLPTRARWCMTGFKYDPSSLYPFHPDIVIGAMVQKCQYCKALKRSGKPHGP